MRLCSLVDGAVDISKKAKGHGRDLSGINFYADKLAELRTDAVVLFRELADPSVGDITAMAEMIGFVFAPQTRYEDRVRTARELLYELKTRKWKTPSSSAAGEEDALFPLGLLTRTRRGYLTSVGRQMNGCFSAGWYDGCAVMMRRLLETVIIEAFEWRGIEANIKNSDGDFFQLSDLIARALNEGSWNLSRNTKQALPRLRDVGHISAHTRRYTAQKADIEKVRQDCRVAIEEFLHLAGLLS